MAFSGRSALDRELNPLAEAAIRLRRERRRVFDLTTSNPTVAGIPYPRAELLRALSHPRALVYEPEPLGPVVAREAIVREWAAIGITAAREHVLITASTSEAYGYVFKLLCDPGDDVLVPAPSYPLFEHLARFEGIEPVPYPLRFDGAWYLDVADIAARVGPRTRAVLVVTPNNPTGQYLKQEELAALAHLGLPVISDEVFAPYAVSRPASAVRSALENADSLVFALSGLSKSAALPQMKLAWLTAGGPTGLVREAMGRLELIADAYLSPSTPVLRALPELLASREPTEKFVLARVGRNCRALREQLTQARSPVSCLPVEGGWYAVLRLPRTRTEESWALGLLEDAGVLVQPGYFYDFSDEAYVVVSLLTEPGEFDAAITRLIRYVADG